MIDFWQDNKALAAQAAPAAFKDLQKRVLPHRETKAREEARANAEALIGNPNARVNRHNERFLDRWWQQAWRRTELLGAIASLDRYIGLSRYAVRGRMSIYAFLDTGIRPMDKVIAFAFDDDYSFGILQSSLHRRWFENRASLGDSISYTTTSAFNTFPWPQAPSPAKVKAVTQVAGAILDHRDSLLASGVTLGKMYDALRLPGRDPLGDLHAELDLAVAAAYGLGRKVDPIQQLLELNHDLAESEKAGKKIRGPGPSGLKDVRVSHGKIPEPTLVPDPAWRRP